MINNQWLIQRQKRKSFLYAQMQKRLMVLGINYKMSWNQVKHYHDHPISSNNGVKKALNLNPTLQIFSFMLCWMCISCHQTFLITLVNLYIFKSGWSIFRSQYFNKLYSYDKLVGSRVFWFYTVEPRKRTNQMCLLIKFLLMSLFVRTTIFLLPKF